ncbi:MAG: leishmanolysin-related zinc metalloendopeptidase [Longimicrobiales bacterium]
MKPNSPRLVVFLSMVAAGCSDSLSEPSSDRPASLRVAEPAAAEYRDGQSARPGEAVAVAPAVQVLNAEFQPVAGVEVRFEVVSGAGSVQFARTISDARGIARAGQWTLGPDPGANELHAVAGAVKLRFLAMGVDAPFRISVRYVSEASTEQRAAIERAVRRWESIVAADLNDHPLLVPAGTCFTNQPAINETIDDLVLFVDIGSLDGAGNYLGEAGPCYLRADNLLPALGYIKLDASDLAQVSTAGFLDDLLLHEVGHVLGVGTLWLAKGLIDGIGSPDPRVRGTHATAAFRVLGGLETDVPAENTGSVLTRDLHWRESVFAHELMTGYINDGDNPLSTLTIGTLRDLGYQVYTNAAHNYTMKTRPTGRSRLDLHAGERAVLPRFTIDRYGRRGILVR